MFQIPRLAVLLFVVCGCAGTPPDYSQRTPGGPAQERKLASLISDSLSEQQSVTQNIVVPVCSDSAGKSSTGWSVDTGEWCVLRCDQPIPESSGDRWIQTIDSRCFVTGNTPGTQTEVAFNWLDLDLDKVPVFDGLSQAFLSNTEWRCVIYNYQVDPGNRRGFWSANDSNGILYRLHRDGRLLTGVDRRSLKLGGSWSVAAGGQVYFNSTAVFSYAIDYGGGRFDDFQNSRLKQICRFVDEVDS